MFFVFVIKKKSKKKDKRLWTARGVGEKIKYYRAYNERDEAQYVIRKIKELVNRNRELNKGFNKDIYAKGNSI